ncbi:MAG TPA: hypothetical protein VGN57_13040 [Pirellulaceae bacterium]|jgi:hypothetical protein|nr:hypothetical protein [Pirellulaceae bacterium]
MQMTERRFGRTECAALFVGLFLSAYSSAGTAFGQSPGIGSPKAGVASEALSPAEYAAANETLSGFVGTWTYRSLVSDPNLGIDFGKLQFGKGTLRLEQPTFETIRGTLNAEGWQLKITGSLSHGDPPTVRFRGRGFVGGEEWVYDFVGYLIPQWPHGEGQRPAIVGSIVRAKQHSSGESTEGYVAQWIAVKVE